MSGEPPPFLDTLPAEVTDGGGLPLLYAVLQHVPPGDVPYLPLAACDHHRADGYVCLPYHKPISRCFRAHR